MPSYARFILLTGVAVIFAATSLLAPAEAAGEKPKARTDVVAVAAGASVRLSVLANDRVARKGKAKVRFTKVPAGLRIKLVKQTAKVAVSPSTVPGMYRARYKVTDTSGRGTGASLKVTVTPTEAGPSTNTLRALVAGLPVAVEHRDGYDRDLFKHWNTGLNPTDGCDTRQEVLISEAVIAPTIGASCALTGGSWYSYYDGVTTTDSTGLDIDHLVPLAEGWDSGAYDWTPARREAYANDEGDPRSLVAVTANANRSKGDQDPGEWQPLLERCRYVAEWTATKYRWALTVDTTEKAALVDMANGCPDTPVTYIVVP